MGVATSRCEAAEAPEEPVEDAPPAEEPAAADSAGDGAGEEAGGEKAEEAEEEEPKMEVVIQTAPHDPRFPSTNQARHCYTRFNEFYRCKAQKGEDDPECVFYKRAFKSMCPGDWSRLAELYKAFRSLYLNDWVERWEEARDAGTWAGKY